jgi:hypothetical protein
MAEQPLAGYRAWLADSIHPRVRGWCSDAAERRLAEAHAQFQLRTQNDEHSRRYAALCSVPGVDHRSYRLRELHLPGGARAIAGIHFRGRATAFPFVGVFAQSRWLSTEETAAAHAALMREFAVFSPRASRWWAPSEAQAPKLAGARADLHLVMGSLAELRGTPAPALPSHWKLRRMESASKVGGAFAELYRSFHAARPDLAEAVPPSSLDDLERCARAEGLYACFSGTEVVGVVAAQPVTQYAVDAWLIWDIVLARQYCGQGIAPVLQRAVLDRLDPARAPLGAGTIDASNSPSLRTALRVGREVVGTWSFIEGRRETAGS